MDEDNFWNLLFKIEDKLKPNVSHSLEVGIDRVLTDLSECDPELRANMRERLAIVTARLAILQIRLPPHV